MNTPGKTPAQTSDVGARRRAMRRYLAHYPRHNPARMVARRSAEWIRARAEALARGRILDIGCGSKWKEPLVSDLVEQYVGLDHVGSMHDRSVVDITGTAYEIPQPDGSFDTILCTSVIEHLEDPLAALCEARRVLRPGGAAIYTVPLFWHLHEQPRDFYRYTPFALQYLFEKAGFDDIGTVAMSGFWLTMASEINYYALATAPRLLRPLVRAGIVVSNAVVPVIDRIDSARHERSGEWTWMHIVTARNPGNRGE